MQKKWIALCLAAMLLLTGCSKTKKPKDPGSQNAVPVLTEAPTQATLPPAMTEATEAATGETQQILEVPDGIPVVTEDAETSEADAEKPAVTTPPAVDGVEPANEKVYVIAEVNVRDAASFQSKVIGKLKGGDEVTRTGIGDDKWDRIDYNGKVGYVAKNYITNESPETVNGTTFEEVNQTVKATSNVNVRRGPGVDYQIIARLKNGEEVKRTGIGSNGWSRITYDGQKCYVANNYLKVVTNDAVPQDG